MDNTPDLERIVRELNAQHGAGRSGAAATLVLDRWLRMLVERGGSDLLLVPGAPASILLEGAVRNLEPGILEGPDIEYRARLAAR